MNCRRVSGLLSAYLDAELALSEMDSIGIHLNECPRCRGEYQSLLDTKRLVASLAHRTSRAEIESLLRTEGDSRLVDSGSSHLFRGALRAKPLTATALLSLAGLWAASASLDSPAGSVTSGAAGVSSPMIAAMPGLGTRSLRYLNDMVHSVGSSTAVMVPVNADGLVLSPESPYPLSVSGYGAQYRHSLSLSNVLSAAAGRRGGSGTVSGPVYIVPASTETGYRGMNSDSGSYSLPARRVSSMEMDRLR